MFSRTSLYIALRLAFVVGAIALSLYLLFYLSGLVYPFIVALVLAYIMNPIVDVLEKRLRFPRPLAVFVTLILVFGSIVGIVILLVIEAIAAATYLLEILPNQFPKLVTYIQDVIVHKIMPLYEELATKFNRLGETQQNTISSNIQSLGADVTQRAQDILTAVLTILTNFLRTLPTMATVLIFVLLATFFISNDWNKMGHRLGSFLPARIRLYSESIFGNLRRALLGFIKAQFTLISMTTIIVLIGLLILRVPYAITVAIVTGAVDLLPYLGTGAVFVPWIFYAYFTGSTPLAVGLLVLYIVVIVQRQIMEPKVLSSNIGLDPLPTLIALFVGFQLYGFLGLIIGPVTLVIVKTMYDANIFRDIWNFVKDVK